MSRRRLQRLFDRLLEEYGPQNWWPARTDFEMTVGAILTQNTAWTNVEKAIVALRGAGLLDPEKMSRARTDRLARLVRPAGYFNQKAKRLKGWARFVVSEWKSLKAARRRDGDELRTELLAVSGIGPETADSILCYALDKRVFVIDAYMRRVLSRIGIARGDEPYEELRSWCQSRLPASPEALGECHALVVRHCKQHCLKNPRCDGCPVARSCASAKKEAQCRR